MKFIIGFFTVRAGSRDEFMETAKPYIAATRAEEGCVYFELNPREEDADGLVVCECFTDEAAHQRHQASDHMQWFRKVLDGTVVDSHFDFVWSEDLETHRSGRAEAAFQIRPRAS